MSGSWPGGEGQLPATKLGIEHVNADPRVLPGYELVLIDYDTEVRKHNLIVYNNSLIRLIALCYYKQICFVFVFGVFCIKSSN